MFAIQRAVQAPMITVTQPFIMCLAVDVVEIVMLVVVLALSRSWS